MDLRDIDWINSTNGAMAYDTNLVGTNGYYALVQRLNASWFRITYEGVQTDSTPLDIYADIGNTLYP